MTGYSEPGDSQLHPHRAGKVVARAWLCLGDLVDAGDEALHDVDIDLASGYRLVRLTISPDEACRFPVDVTSQVRHVEGLQQYLFTPNPGQLVEQLAADDNCAIATFEEIANPGTTQQIDWTFTVS